MTGTELLVTAGAIAAGRWVIRAWFWPFTQCRRCEGRKVNTGSTRKRYGLCKKCGGTGQRQIVGSKQVHRAVRGLRSAASKRKDGRA